MGHAPLQVDELEALLREIRSSTFLSELEVCGAREGYTRIANMSPHEVPSADEVDSLRPKVAASQRRAEIATRPGFTQVPNVLIRHPTLSNWAKLLAAAILMYDWGSGDAFPSQPTLAKDLGWTVKAVKRALRELVNERLILVKRGGNGGRGNVYDTAILKSLSRVT